MRRISASVTSSFRALLVASASSPLVEVVSEFPVSSLVSGSATSVVATCASYGIVLCDTDSSREIETLFSSTSINRRPLTSATKPQHRP
ncbi:hypothetical protein BE221DRAFT_73448 [Ostreococcus tauri]|uniref:Secreted protein n=1 Tax=Ostreococcus tauri TaxID=70448 RepID=A0A1Y5IJ11_OSTTA|nr:hypothetical protein BE221DRAFT_73448 [Ostreococcus tauri]